MPNSTRLPAVKISLILIIAPLLITLTSTSNQPKTYVRPAAVEQYQRQLSSFVDQVQFLNQSVENLKAGRITIEKFQEQLVLTRKKYKEVEFLAAFLDQEFVDDYINGAPLRTLERNSPQLSILEPEGLQVLDELVFTDTPKDHLDEISALTKSLFNQSNKMLDYHQRLPITDRQIIEASRMEMIRLFTLGLTGFDTPGSANAIPESQVALQSVYRAIANYLPLLRSVNKHSIANDTDALFKGALIYLENNQDFDSFDRLEFLITYVNPIYNQLLNLQQALQIESIYEVTPLTQKHSLNYHSTNIFQDDFLNPYYYMRLRANDDSPELIELGRLLFFDPALSSNNQRACASCHDPKKGFSDGLPKSTALDFKGTVKRNSPGLINSVYADRFFYDLRVVILEDQMEHVITSEEEFHSSFLKVSAKIAESEEYVKLFNKSFPEQNSPAVNKYTISTALGTYVKSLKGLNSPVDQYIRGEISYLDEKVKHGFNVFMGKAGCGTCHFAPIFNGTVPPLYHHSESEVLGVPVSTDTLNPKLDDDLGRYDGALKERASIYKHSFKTPTVRNVSLTAPHMHNGVYQTLEEVVDFYNKGGGAAMGMEVPNQTLPPTPLELTDEEKNALVVFMEALADTTGLTEIPARLPVFEKNPSLNQREIGGNY